MDASLNNSSIAETFLMCGKKLKMSHESSQVSAMHNSAIAAIVFNVPLALMALLSNGLIFVAYYQNESLRRPANTILLSLALTDFLTGAIGQPVFIYEEVLVLASNTTKICIIRKLRVFFTIFLLGGTLLNLSVTTLDRYFAVLHGFRYFELVTINRVVKVLVVLWLVWVGILVTGLLSSTIPVIAVVVVNSNIIFITVLYYKIFREIRRLEANPVVAANEEEEARKTRERKTAKTVVIILGLLFFCYIPMILYTVFYVTVNRSRVLNQQLFCIAFTFASSNSSLNVFVYFWRNKEIRFAMLKVVRRLRPATQRFSSEVHP